MRVLLIDFNEIVPQFLEPLASQEETFVTHSLTCGFMVSQTIYLSFSKTLPKAAKRFLKPTSIKTFVTLVTLEQVTSEEVVGVVDLQWRMVTWKAPGGANRYVFIMIMMTQIALITDLYALLSLLFVYIVVSERTKVLVVG